MARKQRRRNSSVTPIAADIATAMQNIGSHTRNVHPEIWARWFQIAGTRLYQKTFPLFFKNGVLTIGVINSTWLHELSFLKQPLLDSITATIGPGQVTELRLILDASIGRYRPPQKPPPPPPSLPPVKLSALPPELGRAADRIDDPELSRIIKQAAARYHSREKDDSSV